MKMLSLVDTYILKFRRKTILESTALDIAYNKL
jgi:hypothetical protein